MHWVARFVRGVAFMSALLPLAGRAAGQGKDVQNDAGAKNPITIGKETTRVVEPLRTDGRVDFARAINQQLSDGVTTENNAAAVVYANTRLYTNIGFEGGLHPLPERHEFYRGLGIEAPPPEHEQETVSGTVFLPRQALGANRVF